MIQSLALIFLVGLSMAAICSKLKIPRILGILVTGIVLGPYVLNVLDEKILNISDELRKIALIIILLKAGLSLNFKDLKKVGRPAILLSFVPASFEILAYFIFAPLVLGVSQIDAAIMGTVMAAVSPAVVVPRMLKLIDNEYGKNKGIPQMIIAGSSCDDVYVIVLFTAFLKMSKGTKVHVLDFLNVPIAISLGIVVGLIIGFLLYLFFELSHIRKHDVLNSIKTVVLLGFAFLLVAVEHWAENKVAFASLLAVVTMGVVIRNKSPKWISENLSEKFSKLWVAAELILFVLVGAKVDFKSLTPKLAGLAVAMIFIGLFIRAFGVLTALIKTKLTIKEKLFCVLSYIPKATVQAAIGAIPLTEGVKAGSIILTVAVLAIMITAPLGSFSIDFTYKKLLHKDENTFVYI